LLVAAFGSEMSSVAKTKVFPSGKQPASINCSPQSRGAAEGPGMCAVTPALRAWLHRLTLHELINAFLFPYFHGLFVFGINLDTNGVDRYIVLLLDIDPVLFNGRIKAH
jgi:hypothetical protein